MTTQSSRYRSDPRAPWRRTVYVQGALGNVETTAPRTTPTPALYGRQCERVAAKELARAGYTVTRSHLSRGGADLVAVGDDGVRQIQVKATANYRPGFLNAGVREIEPLPASARREVWGYVHGRGHVVTVELLPDGAPVVSGREPYRGEVQQALGRRRPAKAPGGRR